MFASDRNKNLVVLSIIVLGSILLSSLAVKSAPTAQPESTAYFDEVRTIYTTDFGISDPVGLAFSPKANALLASNAQGESQPGPSDSNIVMITLFEDPVGSISLAPFVSIAEPLNMAFDDRANSLLIFDQATNQLIEIKAGSNGHPDPANRPITRFEGGQFGLQNARGMAFDPKSGNLFILDAAAQRIVRITPDPQQRFDGPTAQKNGRVFHVNLRQLGPVQPRGIAFNPNNDHLYISNPAELKVYELTETGKLVASLDLSPLSLTDLQGMLFAPSGDNTDDPSIMNLYIADSGRSDGKNQQQRPGKVIELSVIEPVLSTTALSAPKLYATTVQTIDTSTWSPPSPDATGIAYWPAFDVLLTSDSEVDEIPSLFQGANVFKAATNGSLLGTFSTTSFSTEPTGVTVNPDNNHLFFSDDDQKKIFELNPGADGIHGTSDDIVTSIKTGAFNCHDPEDVTFGQGSLFVAGGNAAEVFVVNPGPNGIFDGVPPTGDDQVTHFDTASLGIQDAEGISFNPDSSTLFLASRRETDNAILETTTDGTILRLIIVSAVNTVSKGGVAYAPASTNPAVRHLYIADRGLDNGPFPSENDGKVFEITLDDSPPPDNLLANPGFELNANGDNGPDKWTTDSKFTRSNDVVGHGGSYVGKFYAIDNSGANINQVVNYLSAGTTYNFSGWVNIPPTTDSFTFKLQVLWRNASNATISTNTIKIYTASTTDWDQAIASLVAPAGTTNAQVRMVVSSLNATIYIDDLVFNGIGGPPSPPTIISLTPNSGPIEGGQSVNISGTDLSGATSVTFGGGAATITANTASQITVTTPAHAAGAVDVVVTTPGGTATSTGGYTYQAPPTITGISPNSGPTAGGQSVNINGSDLNGATSVTFGGGAANITANTATQITVTTPAHAAGAVDVVVTTAGGNATSSGGYAYMVPPPPGPVITSFTPGSGPAGTVVTITGSNFTGATAVAFNGTTATFALDSDTQITATVPPGATSGPISVTTAGGTGVSPTNFTVNLLLNPGFELDANNNGKPDSWGNDSRFTRSGDVMRSGTYAGKHFAIDNSGYNLNQTVNNLIAGATYSFSGWVNIPTTSDAFTFKLLVVWKDANSATISSKNVKSYKASTSGWDLASGSLVAPAGTVKAQVRMDLSSLNATIYVDDFEFFKP